MSLIWFQDEIFTVVRDNLQNLEVLRGVEHLLQWGTDTDQLSTWARACTHTYVPISFQNFKEQMLGKITIKNMKKSKNWWEYHQNCFEFFPENGSLILKYLQKRNQHFFQNSRTTQNLVFNMVPVMLLPFCNNFSQESVATGQLSITTRKMKKISFSLWKIHIPSINRLDAGKPTPTLWHVIVVIELTAHNMLSRSCWYQMLVVISCNNVV